MDDYILERVPCPGRHGAKFSRCEADDLAGLKSVISEVKSWGETMFISNTGCVPACSNPTYSVTVRSQWVSPASKVPGARLSLHLVAPRAAETIRTDFLVYDGFSLAGDVGGMLGMLLGASVLSAHDLVEEWWLRLNGEKRWCFANKK